MDSQLIQDTIQMIEQHIDTDAPIRLRSEERSLIDMASLLQTYQITYARKIALLGSYMLLQLATSKHREPARGDHTLLTYHILDGDYLLGLYFRWMIHCNEMALFRYMLPVSKRIQLSMIEGNTSVHVVTELKAHFENYLQENCA